jgi:hypothetical protein
MATTFTLISSTTLGSSASTVNITSIPQTYQDLMIFMCARNTLTGRQDADFQVSGVTSGALYSSNYYEGYATSTVYGSVYGTANSFQPLVSLENGATANYFAWNRIYIANYTKTGKKTLSQFYCDPFDSSSTFYIGVAAGSLPSAALTSILFRSGNNFAANSSFHIYGINK